MLLFILIFKKSWLQWKSEKTTDKSRKPLAFYFRFIFIVDEWSEKHRILGVCFWMRMEWQHSIQNNRIQNQKKNDNNQQFQMIRRLWQCDWIGDWSKRSIKAHLFMMCVGHRWVYIRFYKKKNRTHNTQRVHIIQQLYLETNCYSHIST